MTEAGRTVGDHVDVDVDVIIVGASLSAAAAAKRANVQRFILISANGIKMPGTPYQETKLRAEEHINASGLDATIFRPSVIFGDPRGTMEFATQLYRDMVARSNVL